MTLPEGQTELLITVCTALCLVWTAILYTACSFGRALRASARHRKNDTSLPPLSVVITAHNQGKQLSRNLPILLQQHYPDYEVIVVNDHSNDNTEDVLKQLELRYPQLRHTFTPSSTRYISPKRLALTVGIRSAIHEWVVLTDADCRPASPHWLSRLTESIIGRTDIVLGYVNYRMPPHYPKGRRMIIFRLYHQLLNLNRAVRHTVYKAEAGNIAFRKALFMENRGFADHQHLLAGAEELFVNHTSVTGNTAVASAPEAAVIQEWPTAPRLWEQDRMYYMETRKHLRHKRAFRWAYDCKLLVPYIALAAVGAGCLTDMILPWPGGSIASVLLYLIYMTIQHHTFHRSARLLGETRSFHLLLPFFQIALPFWQAASRLRHLRMPHSTFLKKNL
ncbi:MAG: glycosyltransferase [Paraprevotella sp.]|nr:glycosyltransferase [Paraprevotella sp.]